jgi:transcription initiation factor TFIID subunit TAF12
VFPMSPHTRFPCLLSIQRSKRKLLAAGQPPASNPQQKAQQQNNISAINSGATHQGGTWTRGQKHL